MAKLTQTQIRETADAWALKTREIQRLSAKYDAAKAETVARHDSETSELLSRHADELEPIARKHEPKISKLQAEADELKATVTGWLEKRPKSITIETETAIASFFKGTRPSRDRVASVPKFLEFVKTKGDDVYKCMLVKLKEAQELIGKKELDAICSKPDKDVEEATLVLKS